MDLININICSMHSYFLTVSWIYANLRPSFPLFYFTFYRGNSRIEYFSIMYVLSQKEGPWQVTVTNVPTVFDVVDNMLA